ncbi:hypothetical protein CPLU01_15699 [Colletotrichum plurivorum]|uniref:Uncharacterized protein n=1 Tax=Colletotrichum plurivorum TaxID=2175906 RepID=A0A8H6J902_9PEZI|nr:hypothetical protein CPLU01_15699 [Colletotrichum plurivorum]
MSTSADPDVLVSAYLAARYLLVDHTAQCLQQFLLQLGGWNIGLSPDKRTWEWAIPQAQMPRLRASSWDLIDNPSCNLFEASEDEVKQFGHSEALRRANDRHTLEVVENIKKGGGLPLADYYLSRCARLPSPPKP